jgi:hypothetical protein
MLIDFGLKGYRDFPQLNFDWDKTEVVKDYGMCEVLSIAHNMVSFRFKKDLNELNSNNTLRIKTSTGKVFYFRYEYKMVKEGDMQLRGGVWLTQNPKNIDRSNISVSEINVPMVQNGNIDVCFIGFSDNRWSGFRSLRKDLKQQNQDINFIGSKQDVYGYAYEPAQINKELGYLVEYLDQFPKSDIYILFFETLDISQNREVWEYLVKGLSKKGKKIYLNTWPELKESQKNIEIQKINLLLSEIAVSNDKVEILELNGRNDIGATLLDNGQYFLDNFGYQFYKKEILEHIEGKK